MTGRSSTSVRAVVEQVANHLDLRHLRKISALCVSDPMETSLVLCGDSVVDIGESGGQIELSQQGVCGSPSELSKCIQCSFKH